MQEDDSKDSEDSNEDTFIKSNMNNLDTEHEYGDISGI